MTAFYNEIDRYCCDWLSNLMKAGLITAGDIDDRRIEELEPDDVRGYERVHFFAGIGGWDLALQLAGWPAAQPVWTGSCPCQPFSAAGQGKAADDGRHLWPDWFRLIRAVRPTTVFGEQVESAIGWGWVDLVHADMAAQGYALRFAVLPACSVGAPHIRNRLWFVADELADGIEQGRQGRLFRRQDSQRQDLDRYPRPNGTINELGDTNSRGSQAWSAAAATDRHGHSVVATSWDDLVWIPCSDGKARPAQPGIFPLAHGIPGRVGQLRAAGNAIVPQVAAEFIKANMTCD